MLGAPVRFVDWGSFLFGYRQIFEAQIYRFEPRRRPATIFDCGANIGLAVLYFKELFPDCRLVAFEPDPQIFETLTWNCSARWLDGVELRREAVWTANGSMPFWAEGGDAGRLIRDGSRFSRGARIEVRTVRLRERLESGPVDLLKLDVEGAEDEVLLDCADRLDQIDHIFVEYHSFLAREQSLARILAVLRSAGFRVHIQPELVSSAPFIQRLDSEGMDQRLNIFAYRE